LKIYESHIYANSTDISFDNVEFHLKNKNLVIDSVRYSALWFNNGAFSFKNSSIYGNGTGEGINVNKASAEVSNSFFYNTPDAIEFIDVENGIIKNNIVLNSGDDAIDFNGCSNVIINSNVLIDNKDKGISIGHEGNGSSDKIFISTNTIIGCKTGIAIKDSSHCTITQNVFCNNIMAVHAYHKQYTAVGGYGNINSSIFLNSGEYDAYADNVSEILYTKNITNSNFNNPNIKYKNIKINTNDINAIMQQGIQQTTINLEYVKKQNINYIIITNKSNQIFDLNKYTLSSYRNGIVKEFNANDIIQANAKTTQNITNSVFTDINVFTLIDNNKNIIAKLYLNNL
jgi:parallel beta-helix repeat protein